jgi:hypothetical protein
VGKVVQRKTSIPSKGPQVQHIIPSKPHLIQKPPKNVHEVLPFKIKKMLKDVISFSKFRYGRGVMLLYWVSQSQCQRIFPNKTLYRSYDDYEVDWGKIFRNGVLDISRVHVVSFMGAFVYGVLHPLFTMKHFYKPFPLIKYGSIITGFVVVQIQTQYHKILNNYRKPYHYHLTMKLSHFSDGGGPPQGRLLW